MCVSRGRGDKGKFPSAWKVAKITPIFKGKGSKATPGNYRPISLLSCISKLCERIFYDQLYSHVAPAIHPAQSGFRRGNSTSLQLTRLVQDIIGARAEKLYTGICFFDLAKAFDTVWHRGLLRKLQVIFNISDTPLKWIESYLSGRSQFVSVSGADSPKLPVLSGCLRAQFLDHCFLFCMLMIYQVMFLECYCLLTIQLLCATVKLSNSLSQSCKTR